MEAWVYVLDGAPSQPTLRIAPEDVLEGPFELAAVGLARLLDSARVNVLAENHDRFVADQVLTTGDRYREEAKIGEIGLPVLRRAVGIVRHRARFVAS